MTSFGRELRFGKEKTVVFVGFLSLWERSRTLMGSIH